jgi:hypothetical protein
MAAQAAILTIGNDVANVLMDGIAKTNNANVAADITFNPAGMSPNGVAKWVDRSSGIALGYPWITMQVRAPTKESRVYKVSLKVGVPRMAATSTSTNTGIEPSPQKAYELQAHLDFLLPERSTRNERSKLLAIIQSLFVNTITASDGSPSSTTLTPLDEAVLDFEPAW